MAGPPPLERAADGALHRPDGPPVEGRPGPDGGSELTCRVCGERVTLSGGGWAAEFNAFLAQHAHPERSGG